MRATESRVPRLSLHDRPVRPARPVEPAAEPSTDDAPLGAVVGALIGTAVGVGLWALIGVAIVLLRR